MGDSVLPQYVVKLWGFRLKQNVEVTQTKNNRFLLTCVTTFVYGKRRNFQSQNDVNDSKMTQKLIPYPERPSVTAVHWPYATIKNWDQTIRSFMAQSLFTL